MTDTHILALDLFQSTGVGVLALSLGMFLTRRVAFLRKFCIPSPVSGGIIFSLIAFALYSIWGVELSFNGTMKDICMMIFYTSVGFQSNLTVLKQGGRPLIVLVLLLAVLMIFQNLLPIGIAKAMGVNPLVGLAAGSIPMSGGHGTAGGFSPLLEQMGLNGAATITMAAATFGLLAGSLIGGPLSESLIRRHKLCDESNDPVDAGLASFEASNASPEGRMVHDSTNETEFQHYTRAVYQILLVLGFSTLLSKLLSLTGLSFPTYFGTLILASIVRNVSEVRSKKTGRESRVEMDKIVTLGNICLSLFLGMAMVSLRLWELADLALPLVAMLAGQIALMALFVYFVAFPLLGRNYDSAVLVSGICGFGLGATPNAMANMSAVCYKYKYTVNPFVIVPIVGAMFVDIMNTGIITAFLNLLK